VIFFIDQARVKLKNAGGLFIVVQFYPWFKLYFCKGLLYSLIGSLKSHNGDSSEHVT